MRLTMVTYRLTPGLAPAAIGGQPNMPQTRILPTALLGSLAASLVTLASPAVAAGQAATDAEGRVFGNAPYDPRADWKPAPQQQPTLPPIPSVDQTGLSAMAQAEQQRIAWEEAKADWLAECRTRVGRKGRTTGTIVGGLVGGVAGSAIAGSGNRVVGAIAGGTLGAVAGSAIGNASDKRRARDYCESYLDDYLARQQSGYGPVGYGPVGYGPVGYGPAGLGYTAPGYAYGYTMQPVMTAGPMTMVPIAAPAAPKQDCKETTVIEEWVTVSHPKRRIIHDKRVRIVPDKRVRTK